MATGTGQGAEAAACDAASLSEPLQRTTIRILPPPPPPPPPNLTASAALPSIAVYRRHHGLAVPLTDENGFASGNLHWMLATCCAEGST